MRLVLVLAAALCSLAATQQEQPCKSPPYLMGQFIASLPGQTVMIYNYEYNTALQQMRISDEIQKRTNQSFTYEYILHFREGVMYEIEEQTSKCTKRPLKTHYQPIGIPADASLGENYVLGSLSAPGAGIRLYIWEGYTPGGEQYLMSVTESECVPESTIYYTAKYGKVDIVFINNTMPMALDDLSAPQFCPDSKAKPEGMPVNFLSLFSKSKTRHFLRTLTKLKSVFIHG